jgi:phenylacetate-CoA ligase
MKEAVKKIAESVPYSLGSIIGKLPMSLRLGSTYNYFSEKLKVQLRTEDQKEEHLQKIQKLLKHASTDVRFYQSFYNEQNGLFPRPKTFEDILSVPIVKKDDFQKYPLNERSVSHLALKKSNTGGTTGQPLDFFLEKTAYAREWAHMHAIWARLGYRFTDEKITIRGKNIGNGFYKYNFNQNEFLINAYTPLLEHLEVCRKLIIKRNIKWIHGYPSAVFSFLRELETVDSILFEILIKKIKGVFLGSEYPAPQYRNYIEKHCGLKSISWYGHSEMAVLAPEREPGSGIYFPFHSYGFSEAIPDGESYRLVATSTNNFATPLIRYDTGDLIEPNFKDGLLESFRIKEGRNSDSVIDINGRSISLTGLIFGRHHKAFNHSEHIQVSQPAPGKIEILITSKETRSSWGDLFDFSNSFFDVSFKQIESPIRTPAGKVQLLLRHQ